MFCRNITTFICIFVAAVIATLHNDSISITASDPEASVYRLTTEKPESSEAEVNLEGELTVAVDLPNLLDAGVDAIVVIVSGVTHLVAHRAVFADLLGDGWLGTSSDYIVVPDVEGPVLRQLVAYLYTLQAPELPDMAAKLLVAADKFGVYSLKAACERQLATCLTVDNAAATLALAIRHSCDWLRKAAVTFVEANLTLVMATPGWADVEDEVSWLFPELPGETSTPAPCVSGATPTTQQHSSHSSQTPASAAPTTTTHHISTPDYAAVCPLWSLSREKKNGKLIDVAKKGAVGDVEALLAAGADVEAVDEWTTTALHWAAMRGHVEVTRRLLAAGAAVDARSRWQETPLHFAAQNGHTAVVRLLVEEASADPNARSWNGWTPLHWATKWGRAEVVAALLQAGADRGATDKEGRTPLDIARKEDRQQLIDILT